MQTHEGGRQPSFHSALTCNVPQYIVVATVSATSQTALVSQVQRAQNTYNKR
jgi:hypothetical protein